MFWAKRLKQADGDADGSWILSYGDLMSLLLVITVMVAAMGELRADHRFSKLSDGVREAFGFTKATASGAVIAASAGRAPTLLERLEQVGFERRSMVQLVGPDDEVLGNCDVIVGNQTITLRIAGDVSFAPNSAVLEPTGARALRRIAEYLAEGTSRIEVRSYGKPGPLPAGVPFRDGMDLSYARGRAAIDVLAEKLDRGRLYVTAGSAQASSSGQTAFEADRGMEMIVHAVAGAEHE